MQLRPAERIGLIQLGSICLDRQETKSDYIRRAIVAFLAAWIVVTFYNFTLRVVSKLDVETAVTIIVVASIASLLSGFLSAVCFRKQVPMILASQLLSMSLVAFVARL